MKGQERKHRIEVLNDDKFVPLKVDLSVEDAWYWWGRLWEMKETVVITHPDDEPF